MNPGEAQLRRGVSFVRLAVFQRARCADGLSEGVLPCVLSPENSKQECRFLVEDGELLLYPMHTIWALRRLWDPSAKTIVIEDGQGLLT